MSTLSYDDRSASYADDHRAGRAGRAERVPIGGGLIFLWIAWIVAALFWAASMRIDFGILEAVQHPMAAMQGDVAEGGLQWALIDIVGVVVVGLAILYGLARYVTRNRRNDPVTEAATAALYDQAGSEPDGGSSESPNSRTPQERAINRGVQPPVE